MLGLELSAGFHPAGPPIRDKGHQALIRRFLALLGPAWAVAAEVPFPGPGDPRVWDLLLRSAGQVVGVEAETRIRDIQALSRRIHLRQRDGGVDVVLLVLSRSGHNRRLAGELRGSLGPAYTTPVRPLASALRAGRALPGSGVLLM